MTTDSMTTAGAAQGGATEGKKATLTHESPSKPNATIVWDAIVELHNAHRSISRQVLRDLTGLKITIIDDHVERLDEKEKIRKVGAGLIELIEEYAEPRACSVTEISNGCVKIEFGDEIWHTHPDEARRLARQLAGYLYQMDEIDRSNRALIRTSELALQVRELRGEVVALKKRMQSVDGAQMDLLACGA